MNAKIAAEKIRKVYRQIARPGEWVRVYDLWAGILDCDMTHVELTEGLRIIGRTDGVLIPESNQKTLRPEDREARVWIGNQWKDLLSIES